MINLIRYGLARLRHPGPQARGFLRAGLGIEGRGRRLKRYWSLHHKASKAAQVRWLESVPRGGSLEIHGPGRLADVAWPELSTHFDRITLVDADPLCLPTWQRLTGPAHRSYETRELSGVAAGWSERMRSVKGDWPSVLDAARTFADHAADPPRVEADAVLSVNLLSQIPLAWQDAFEDELRRRFGSAVMQEKEREWLDALAPGARWIVEAQARSYGGARHGLLITDLDYVYYRGCPPYLSWRYRDAPLRWDGAWTADSGVTCEVEPALFGADPDSDSFWSALPDHTVAAREHWLWHIAPVGTEDSPDGVLHRVGAYAFERRPAGRLTVAR